MEKTLNNYYNAFKKSQECLNLLQIDSFPIDLLKLCKDMNIIISTKKDYIQFRKDTQQPLPEIPIRDGRSYKTYINGQKTFLIIYDEKPYWRWRFTIAHELGHILLGHLNDSRLEIDRGGIDSKFYQKLENEADVFAGNFLAPPILIHEKLTSYPFPYPDSTISNTFHISQSAARNFRWADYKIWRLIKTHTPSEYAILDKFGKEMHYHRCTKCQMYSVAPREEYCRICGTKNQFHRFRGGEEVVYSKIILDENNKPFKCPNCDNENLPLNGEFCQICGTPIYNNCTNMGGMNSTCNNGEHLDGDARFCPYCGCETTYLTNGILKKYVEERNTQANAESESSFDNTTYPF